MLGDTATPHLSGAAFIPRPGSCPGSAPGSALEGHCHLAPIRRALRSGRGLCHSLTPANYPARSLLACPKQALPIPSSDSPADAAVPRLIPGCLQVVVVEKAAPAFPFLFSGQSGSFSFLSPVFFFLSSLHGWAEMGLGKVQQNHEFGVQVPPKLRHKGGCEHNKPKPPLYTAPWLKGSNAHPEMPPPSLS